MTHMVYYTIMQSKRLYAWETGPVDDIALGLLCGDSADIRVRCPVSHHVKGLTDAVCRSYLLCPCR